MKDSIFNDENASKMKGLEMQYDFDKDAAIQKAERDKKDALIATAIATQRFKHNVIYLGLAMLVFFLLIVIILRTKLAKERRLKGLEQERSRISKDLHDDLGSGLISILMMTEQMQNPDNKFLISGNVEKIKQSSKMMVEQMRVIIWAMNSMNDTLENLLIYIQNYSLDYFENLPIKSTIHLPEIIPIKNMTGMARRNVFLVVKESLNNITKHSKATEFEINIIVENDSMNIVITDNGNGFDVNETRRFGNGLKNMNSRMKELNGTFFIESIIGKGTKTSINFPLS
jgi:signal transduction histidine kinase